MKPHLKCAPTLELTFIAQDIHQTQHQAELRHWSRYLSDLLPALLLVEADD